jgi:la-related protein 1
MDNQGFVHLNVISNFKRIRKLTQGIHMVRSACLKSSVLEVSTGLDGVDRVRCKEGWRQWVLTAAPQRESRKNLLRNI